MKIQQIIASLETWAPSRYQESYDNSGLITGDPNWNCTGILCTLDATAEVVEEAISRQCNLVVAHHPILFSALRKLSGDSYVEKTLVKAIKNDVAIYALHTNLDNISSGVNAAFAAKIGLGENSLKILAPKPGLLCKLFTYVPPTHEEIVKTALFNAGAGTIGLYNECSFSGPGTGTFKALPGSSPVIGEAGGGRENVAESKLEVIFPAHLQAKVLAALSQSHPYEVPAYEIIRLENIYQEVGSGMIGELPAPVAEIDLLENLKQIFGPKAIKHTALRNKPVQKIALCGGAGSFLTKQAIAAGADVYITSDVKYHEFFDAEDRILLIDIGHWESEQFTIDCIANFLQHKFPTFAVLKTGVNTNPVHYFV
jgi:dinuclear metal center YbgI/SA1388 family protein